MIITNYYIFLQKNQSDMGENMAIIRGVIAIIFCLHKL